MSGTSLLLSFVFFLCQTHAGYCCFSKKKGGGGAVAARVKNSANGSAWQGWIWLWFPVSKAAARLLSGMCLDNVC